MFNEELFENLNAISWKTFNLNLLVHKTDDHEIIENCLEIKNENTAADFKLFNIESPN